MYNLDLNTHIRKKLKLEFELPHAPLHIDIYLSCHVNNLNFFNLLKFHYKFNNILKLFFYKF